MDINEENWTMWSKWIADPSDPEEHSPAAMDRLMNVLDNYIVRVTNVRPQYHALNQVRIIDFETEEGRKYYDDAIERFLKKKARIEGSDTMSAAQKNIAILVAMLQYRIAAESNPDRIRFICREMYRSVQEGYASAAAFNFKVTITKCVQYLRENYNVDRNLISLIWGGGTTEPTSKQKAKATIEQDDDLAAALLKAGISMEDLNLDDVEAKLEAEVLDPALRLGAQSLKERQKEIDRYQSGKSLYCFYTFRAGGVGLSLHHTDELTKEKVRKKPSGYAFEEDIPKIPTRPRQTFVAPTWSAIELVQGLGRVPRLTSLSDTPQALIFFAGTIEEKVARIVSMKLRCLSKVVRQKESWEGVIIGNYTDKQIEERHLKDEAPDEEEIFGSTSDSDES